MASAYQHLIHDCAESVHAQWIMEAGTMMLYTAYSDIAESAYNIMLKPARSVINEGIARADYDEEIDIIEWDGDSWQAYVTDGGYCGMFVWVHPIKSGLVAFNTEAQDVYMVENSDYDTPETWFVTEDNELVQIY